MLHVALMYCFIERVPRWLHDAFWYSEELFSHIYWWYFCLNLVYDITLCLTWSLPYSHHLYFTKETSVQSAQFLLQNYNKHLVLFGVLTAKFQGTSCTLWYVDCKISMQISERLYVPYIREVPIFKGCSSGFVKQIVSYFWTPKSMSRLVH